MSRKVVLITGTNSGFGWLTAKTVASLGHKVYATIRDTKGKNADKAKALAQGQVIDLTDKAYAFLTLPKPKGRGHSSLLEPVGKVTGQAKDAELRGPAK